eukprot:SAG31_NODE_7644_length_1632_cov_1.001957_2_plen_299_part_00
MGAFCAAATHLLNIRSRLQLAYDMAVKSFVLLKNIEETLPLQQLTSGGKLCVFGVRAKVTAIGNYANTGTLARYNQTFLEAIHSRLGDDQVVYASGCQADGEMCPLECTEPDHIVIRTALAQCSASVVVTGTVTSGELGIPASCGAHGSIYYEAEGSDRPTAALPAEALLQVVAAVAAEAASTVAPHKVVLLLANAGSVELGWAKASTQIGAILHTSFPGQAAGAAGAAAGAAASGASAGAAGAASAAGAVSGMLPVVLVVVMLVVMLLLRLLCCCVPAEPPPLLHHQDHAHGRGQVL